MDAFNLYEAIGGTRTCRQLSEAFYGRVKHDPVLRPLFPGKTLKCAIEAFAAFLVQFLGGPAEDTQRRWWLSLRESHSRFKIGLKERNAWMKTMIQALDDVPIDEPARNALRQFFERSSAYLVNTESATAESNEERTPSSDPAHEEISRRWSAQQALEEAMAAVRGGDPDRAVAIASAPGLQTYFKNNRAVFAGFLAAFMGSSDGEYVRDQLMADPALVKERYGGRTLLHVAAAAGDLVTVELLLRLGASAHATTDGGHTPLYCVGNECKSGGTRVVHALVQAGARVDACDGVKRCTPLHMAARRDNVEVARALLECGADIEARDSAGDTPLRRSVNCNQTGVATLLIARGADACSVGSKGISARLAAKTPAMKKLMQ